MFVLGLQVTAFPSYDSYGGQEFSSGYIGPLFDATIGPKLEAGQKLQDTLRCIILCLDGGFKLAEQVNAAFKCITTAMNENHAILAQYCGSGGYKELMGEFMKLQYHLVQLQVLSLSLPYIIALVLHFKHFLSVLSLSPDCFNLLPA